MSGDYDDILEADPGGSFPFRVNKALKWTLGTITFAVVGLSLFIGHEVLHCIPDMVIHQTPCSITLYHPMTWLDTGVVMSASPGSDADHWWVWPLTVLALVGAWVMWADTVGD